MPEHRCGAAFTLSCAALVLASTASTARADAPTTRQEHESEAAMYTGAVLSILGGVGLAAGNVLLFALPRGPDDWEGLTIFLIGAQVMLPSSVLLHVGIPLWAFGASKPDLRIGARGAELHWSF